MTEQEFKELKTRDQVVLGYTVYNVISSKYHGFRYIVKLESLDKCHNLTLTEMEACALVKVM